MHYIHHFTEWRFGHIKLVLPRHFISKCLYQDRQVRGHVSILSLSTISIFVFGIVPTVLYLFSFIFIFIKQILWKMNFIYFKKINKSIIRSQFTIQEENNDKKQLNYLVY